jgi:DNA (cytosine-5)-methyltransferase 1
VLNGLDLFSGIGGLSIALADWVRVAAYCERDAYAQGVLLSRMSKGDIDPAPIATDIRELLCSQLPKEIDIIYGGFPCQDISVAGHGKGLAGERSGLYWEMHRLIRDIRPSFVFLENVPAIRTRGLKDVVWSLAELGYDCRWDVISAREVGASFIGDRWFLLAAANREALRIEQGRSEGSSRNDETFNPSTCVERLAPWSPERGFESRVFGTGNGIPFAVDRDRALGNAVVPAQAKKAFMRLMGLDSAQESGKETK